MKVSIQILDALQTNMAGEIGVSDSYNDNSFIKAFDEGGTVWIGEENYPSMEKALQDLGQALDDWFADVIGEK